MRKVPVYGLFLILSVMLVATTGAAYAADSGATFFAAKCAMCHGADGQGKTPMGAKLNIKDLSSPEIQQQSAADLSQTIAKGKNKMPAYDGKLTKDEIAQLSTYIKSLGKK